jgi:hypothetical protein
MKFKLIPDYRNKNLKCHFCEETRSVKYEAIIDSKKVCLCNKCAWNSINHHTEK